jgi:3-oxoacyl-[acyl-carrier protein] reductase
MKFKDKVVLITGASRGIGKATALAFAKEGASVIIDYFVSDVEPEADLNAKKVVESIEKMGSMAMAIEADVSNEDQIKILVGKIINTYGKIDILVNNAGIAIDLPFAERTVEHWKHTLAVDLIGGFICSKNVIPHMIKSGGGKIINLASNSGTVSFSPDSIDYDSAKAAVVAMTKNLAKENTINNIRVNAVAPGWVNTTMNAKLPDEYVKSEKKRIYLKRFAEPEEIANLILFLASDEASYINGTTVTIDGGYE